MSKLHLVIPTPGVRDALVQQLITWCKQDTEELESSLSSLKGKSIEQLIQSLKAAASALVDRYKKEQQPSKRAYQLSNAIFYAARYRDTKYAAANRKFLFGLGYRNSMIASGKTVFSIKQLEVNAK